MTEGPAKAVPFRDPAELPEHQRRRRQRIIAAALDLLRKADYERVQMRDVADRADVALGTVYRYFSSKEHLYAAALVEWATTSVSTLMGVADREHDAEARLRRALRRTVRALADWPQIVRTEMQLEVSSDENARELLDVLWALYDAVLRGALWDMPPDTADAVVDTCSSEAYRTMRRWALGKCSLAEVQRHFDRTITLIFSPAPNAGRRDVRNLPVTE
jgi:AcrR family transcriptional regulator